MTERARVCGWCGADLSSRRETVKWCDGRCKNAAYEARAGKRLPSPHYRRVLTVSDAKAKRTRTPDRRVSVSKAVEKLAADYQFGFGLTPTAATARAERVIARALPPRLRKDPCAAR